jgi:5'-nucleotidase (lipoprotein e(P4) family)
MSTRGAVAFALALALAAGRTGAAPAASALAPAAPAGGPVAAPGPARANPAEWTLGAVAWTQSSGEWRALSYQAFALARRILDDDLQHGRRRPQRAMVVDVDETVLDNAPFQARMLARGTGFAGADWPGWVASAGAEAMPGAVDLLKYAASRGVVVYYVTNRSEAERAGTARDLREHGFPGVTAETLLMRGDTASKEPRRQAIARDHRIVLLMGDNLNDLASAFELGDAAARRSAVDRHRAEFGTRFVMLPNPMYGAWDDVLHADPAADSATKRQDRLRALRPAP